MLAVDATSTSQRPPDILDAILAITKPEETRIFRELSALRRDIAELREMLSPNSATIVTGREAIDEFKKLSQESAKTHA